MRAPYPMPNLHTAMFMHQLSYCFCVLASCACERKTVLRRMLSIIEHTGNQDLPNFRCFVCTGGANGVKQKKCETKCKQCDKYLDCL